MHHHTVNTRYLSGGKTKILRPKRLYPLIRCSTGWTRASKSQSSLESTRILSPVPHTLLHISLRIFGVPARVSHALPRAGDSIPSLDI